MANKANKNTKENNKVVNKPKVVEKKATSNKDVASTKKSNGASKKDSVTKVVPKEGKVGVSSKKKNEKHQEAKTVKRGRPDEVTKLVEVVLILLAIFAAFYLITYWVTNAKKSTPNTGDTGIDNTVIQYDEILLGNLLDQNKDEYYVLVMSKGEIKDKAFGTEIQTYKAKEGSLRLYTANLDDIFNKPYRSDSSRFDTEAVSEVRVRTTTLIKVKDQRIVETTEDSSAVRSKLVELGK